MAKSTHWPSMALKSPSTSPFTGGLAGTFSRMNTKAPSSIRAAAAPMITATVR